MPNERSPRRRLESTQDARHGRRHWTNEQRAAAQHRPRRFADSAPSDNSEEIEVGPLPISCLTRKFPYVLDCPACPGNSTPIIQGDPKIWHTFCTSYSFIKY